MAKTHKN